MDMRAGWLSASALGLIMAVQGAAIAQEFEAEGGITTLDRIVVSAGQDKVAIDTPQAVSVVDQEDLEMEQPTTIGDALSDLPGIKTAGSDRVLGESFNIRGFGTATSSDESRIITQVDGATKFHEQYRLGSLFTDPELYKSVEVLRGPASSTLYGSGALAGVISLKTKDAADFLDEDDRLGGRQKLEFSDNGKGFLTSTIAALRPTGNVDLLAAFNVRKAGDLEDGDGEEIEGTDFEAVSGLVKGTAFLGTDREHRLTASYQRWETKDEDQPLAQTETSPDFGTIDREVVDQTAILSYGFEPYSNDLVDLDVTFSYSESDVEQKDASQEGAFGGSALFQDTHYAYEFIESRIENTASFFGEDYENHLTTGVQGQLQTRTADTIDGPIALDDPDAPVVPGTGEEEGISFHPGGESRSIGAYVQNEFVYNEKLTLIPGIRYDWRELEAGDLVADQPKDSIDRAISPKLAAHYQVTPIVGLFGSVAYTERLPVLDELYDETSGNPDLEKETSINYEAGLALSFNDVLQDNDGLSAKLTFFHNDVDDLIERESTSDPFLNIGEAEIEGLELEASYESERLFSKVAYTLIRGEGRENPGDPIEPLTSIPTDELVLTVGTHVPEHDLDLGVRALFAARQDRVPDDAEETPGYGVVDVFSAWRPDEGAWAGTEVRFGVENLFDKTYREALATNHFGDNSKGRTLKLTLAMNF